MNQKIIPILATCAISIVSSQAMASGWVKGSGSYYFKLATSQSEAKTSQVNTIPLEEKDSSYSVYGEYGLDNFSWKSQVGFYGAYKSIERTETIASADNMIASLKLIFGSLASMKFLILEHMESQYLFLLRRCWLPAHNLINLLWATKRIRGSTCEQRLLLATVDKKLVDSFLD